MGLGLKTGGSGRMRPFAGVVCPELRRRPVAAASRDLPFRTKGSDIGDYDDKRR